MLADLCRRCASEADVLVERYGGRGRDAIRLTQPDAASSDTAVRKLGGGAVRGFVYVSIALVSFLLVTWVTSIR